MPLDKKLSYEFFCEDQCLNIRHIGHINILHKREYFQKMIFFIVDSNLSRFYTKQNKIIHSVKFKQERKNLSTIVQKTIVQLITE